MSDQQAPPRLKETDVYYFQVGFDLDGLIEEKLCAIKTESTAPSCTKWPTEGQIFLRETQSDGYRTFVISEAQRSRLVLDDTRLPLIEASDVTTFSWEKASLYEIASALDQAGCDPANHLHQSHRSSLNAIVRNDGCIEAHAGKFYRVNAPTGTGKTVVMQLMGIHTALQRHRVVIAVPNLTDVRNMVEALKRSVRTVAPHLKRRLLEARTFTRSHWSALVMTTMGVAASFISARARPVSASLGIGVVWVSSR